MAYTIRSLIKTSKNIQVQVDFDYGKSGSVEFPLTATKAEILAKLNEIETGFTNSKTSQDTQLGPDLSSLFGYKKV